MCVLSIKVPIRKKSANLFNDPRKIFVLYNFQATRNKKSILYEKLQETKLSLTPLRDYFSFKLSGEVFSS